MTKKHFATVAYYSIVDLCPTRSELVGPFESAKEREKKLQKLSNDAENEFLLLITRFDVSCWADGNADARVEFVKGEVCLPGD